MAAVAASAQDFTIIVLPDTQKYSCGTPCGSNPAMFEAQTQWIVDNKDALNIVYVAHEGDIVEHATTAVEWDRADGAMSLLEDPVTTSLPYGIPYGVLRGNHDQDSTYDYYNQHFGVGRFSGRSYYGGSFDGTNNNNNYTLFSASGMDFIVINLEYNPSIAVRNWADALLETYSNRRAIVVSHYIINIGNPGTFNSMGEAIYNALKDHPNLFLMLCGHMHGEGSRVDVYNGNIVDTLLADYQSYTNGGNGFLRILTFSPVKNEITVETYSPWLGQYETDPDSQFVLDYDMGGPPVKGDFDGDKKSDILWQYTTDGTVAIWLMDGTSISSGGSPGVVSDPNWEIKGVGDFNGDKKADILWQYTTDGTVAIWLMDGTSISSGGSPGVVSDPNWEIKGVGAFNGDGNSDILWQYGTDGTVAIWLMNGTTIAYGGSPAVVDDPNWEIMN